MQTPMSNDIAALKTKPFWISQNMEIIYKYEWTEPREIKKQEQ